MQAVQPAGAQVSCINKPLHLPQPAAILSSSDAPEALRGVRTLILDCDGVLWRGNDVIPGVPAALTALRQQGLRLLFVTNNSSTSRRQYVAKFESLDLSVSEGEIVAASYLAAAYLAAGTAAGPGLPRPGQALAFGTQGLYDELHTAGVAFQPHTENAYCAATTPWDLHEFGGLALSSNFSAVVLGFCPDFSYRHLCFAAAVLRETPGCELIGTNPDTGDRITEQRIMPGTGCMIAALEAAIGRPATVVGKGGPWLLPFLCRHFDLQPASTAIVGDRLDTDVATGIAGGLRTIMPLTGVCTLEDVMRAPPGEQPEFVVPSLVSLAGAAETGQVQVAV